MQVQFVLMVLLGATVFGLILVREWPLHFDLKTIEAMPRG